MRRLPIFFVLDCSESMIGDNKKKLEETLEVVTHTLKQDPHALESVYPSVIAFAGVSKTIVPLVEIVSFYPPKLPVGSGTRLGLALEELMLQIDKHVVKTTSDRKGDWKPIIFLITDGKPTDQLDFILKKWEENYKTKAQMIAVAIGRYADVNILKKITENVIIFENSQENDFKKFISWMTASIVTCSKSIGENNNVSIIDNLDESVLKKAEKNKQYDLIDIDCAVLVGRCQKSKKPYLMKYDCSDKDLTYELSGCYPIDENYFKWSDSSNSDIKINTSELIGIPSCPYCGAVSAFALCECGKLMCVNSPGEAICPWCEQKVIFGSGSENESYDFNVSRGRG